MTSNDILETFGTCQEGNKYDTIESKIVCTTLLIILLSQSSLEYKDIFCPIDIIISMSGETKKLNMCIIWLCGTQSKLSFEESRSRSFLVSTLWVVWWINAGIGAIFHPHLVWWEPCSIDLSSLVCLNSKHLDWVTDSCTYRTIHAAALLWDAAKAIVKLTCMTQTKYTHKHTLG